MKHWEERKVKLRVELGPADVEAGSCVLATAAPKAGDLAAKVKLRGVSRCLRELTALCAIV